MRALWPTTCEVGFSHIICTENRETGKQGLSFYVAFSKNDKIL